MLIVHKIIDALRGKAKHIKVDAMPGLTKDICLNAAALLEESEKFDFGALPLEKGPGNGVWAAPALTHDEMDFWHQGYIPLPAPVVWFEFIMGGTPVGLLIVDDGKAEWLIQRIDLVLGDTTVLYTGCVLIGMQNKNWEKDTAVRFGGNLRAVEKDAVAFLQIAIYMALMLNSKTTEIVRVEKRPSKNRVRRGLAPLQSHRIVRIVPERYQYETDSVTGIKRRSPRLHWRRSHVRRVPGREPKVIARMLVGRADLGEVSHEYKIMTDERTE